MKPKSLNNFEKASFNPSIKDSSDLDASLSQKISLITRSDSLLKFADSLVHQRPMPSQRRVFLSGEPMALADLPTQEEVRRLVQYHIASEFDHPAVVDAVSEYIFDHIFLLTDDLA